MQTSVSVLVGEVVTFELESQCINGKRWKVSITGGGLNLGVSPSKAGIVNWTSQPIALGDPFEELLDPEDVFGNWYMSVDATMAVPGIAGVGCSANVVGMDALPHVGGQSAGCGGVSGFKVGFGLGFGAHKIKKRLVKCDDCETPIKY